MRRRRGRRQSCLRLPRIMNGLVKVDHGEVELKVEFVVCTVVCAVV
jgi:hypothetical protein